MHRLLAALCVSAAVGLVPNAPQRAPLTPRKGFFDNAFKNESFDNKPNAGSGLSTQKKTVPVKIGSRTVQAMPGQRMKDVVRAARAPIKFNCEDGQCGTCESKVDGRVTRVCVAKIPARGCTITRK
mmetsp:Transcript_18225/g.51942  ORF Transcript_18225/g.51942 Transcript_18225/m.51942 type:complete len:126 (+) Transcript_18225:146-523(+)